MANASAKKTAASNERAISNLRQGLLITITLSTFIRLVSRRQSLSPTRLSFWLHILSQVLSTFIARYLARIGDPKRSETGELISPGEDLNQPGVIEWCFDVIYVTCKRVPSFSITTGKRCSPGACQIGSATFGEKFWWLASAVSPTSPSHSLDLISTASVDPTICALQNLVVIPWTISWLWEVVWFT